MAEDKYEALKRRWYEGRIRDYHERLEFDWDTSLKFVLKFDEPKARERGMTMDEYIDYDFRRYCQTKLQETQYAREQHALKLLREGHTKEALYMLEALLAEGYCTIGFPMSLAKTYRKLKRLDDEIRVLERGIYLFEHLLEDLHPLDQHRPWSTLNANLLRERLEKAKGWKAKAEARKAK